MWDEGDQSREEHDLVRRTVAVPEPAPARAPRTRGLLTLLTDLEADIGDPEHLVDRLRMFHEAATARVTALREQLAVAEGFADTLAGRLQGRR